MKWAIICCALLLAGCSTVSDVLPIGKDTYMVTSEVYGFKTSNDAEEMTIKRANAYCESLGKKMLLANISGGGVYGFSPRTNQLVFQCLSANDPAFTRTQLQKEPNTVIEVKTQPPPAL